MRNPDICIVIDGGAATGKTSTAMGVARALGYRHLSTGLLYRAVAWQVRRAGIAPHDEAAVSACMTAHPLTITKTATAGNNELHCNGVLLSESLLSQAELSETASVVSALAEVRRLLLPLQRDFAAGGACVLDGRDLGTVVLPNAELKIFLTADLAVRARRRMQQLRTKGQSEAAVQAALAARDARDTTRTLSPLRPAANAHQLDTGTMSQHEQIARIVKLAQTA